MAEYRYASAEKEYPVAIIRKDDHTWLATIDRKEYSITLDERQSTRLDVRIAGRGYHCHVDAQGDDRFISWRGNSYVLRRVDREGTEQRIDHGKNPEFDPEIRAPMPGKVIKIYVNAGDNLEQNTPVIVLEAMKMEYTLNAPVAGIVERVCFAVGDRVDLGSTLAVMAMPKEIIDE